MTKNSDSRDTEAPADSRGVRARIVQECDAIKELLLSKNESYGNSIFDPMRVFSKADVKEALLVRIDDKLSRVARGKGISEDTTLDLIGYLILYRIAVAGPPDAEPHPFRPPIDLFSVSVRHLFH